MMALEGHGHLRVEIAIQPHLSIFPGPLILTSIYPRVGILAGISDSFENLTRPGSTVVLG